MSIMNVPIIAISVMTIGFIVAILLVTANNYIDNFKISKGKVNFHKSLKLNLKKLINELFREKIYLSKVEFVSRFFVFCCSIYLMHLYILGNASLEKYGLLLFFVVFILNRRFDFVFNSSKKNYNYLLRINLLSISYFMLIFGFSTYTLPIIELNKSTSLILKLVIFANFVFSIYSTDIFIEKLYKHKLLTTHIFHKLYFYFLMISIFISLNQSSLIKQTEFKFLYYTMSIILIEFMSSYIRKNISSLKESLITKYYISYSLNIILASFVIVIGVKYVL
jgi:hypothetical protein